MKPLIDTHTHTIHSCHAANTVFENAQRASEMGLQAIVTTDHGPSVIGYKRVQNLIEELIALPEYLNGVRIYKGAEANIVDFYGDIDIPQTWLELTDFMLASFHGGHIKVGTVSDYTSAVLGALQNPFVDVIAHPGNPEFPVDIETIVLAAKSHGKLIEINNHSPFARKNSEANCMEFLRLCKKHSTKIVLASDSHEIESLGDFGIVFGMLKEIRMPDELVLSADSKAFSEYLELRRHRLKKTDRS